MIPMLTSAHRHLETSEPSGEDSDVEEEEEDQIRATPAPTTLVESLSGRPPYKRKESGWKSESVSKRARHEQAGASMNSSVRGSQPGKSAASYFPLFEPWLTIS